MKKKLLKFFGIVAISCLLGFNIVFSLNLDKSSVTLSSLVESSQANAEGVDYDNCHYSQYGGGDYGMFLFCGYEITSTSCSPCGSFIPH